MSKIDILPTMTIMVTKLIGDHYWKKRKNLKLVVDSFSFLDSSFVLLICNFGFTLNGSVLSQIYQHVWSTCTT